MKKIITLITLCVLIGGDSFAQTTCFTPTGVTVASITTNSAIVTWNSVAGALSYNVRHRAIGNPLWIFQNTTATTVTLTGLLSQTSYEVQVQAVCGSNTSNVSLFTSSVPFVTTGNSSSLCLTPTGITVANITPTSAVVSWSAVTGAVGYNVRYRPIGAPSWQTISTALTTATLINLLQQTPYEVQVRTICGPVSNSNSVSLYSASVTFLTTGSNTTCPTPTGLTVVNISTSSAFTTWNAVTGAISYNIRYKPVSSVIWTTVTSATNSRILTGLTSMTQYMVQVQTVCMGPSNTTNVSAFSPAVYFLTLGSNVTCTAPSVVYASNITASSALLNWNATGAPQYNIRYRPAASLSWLFTNSTTNSKLLTGLTNQTLYEAQVRSVCFTTSNAFPTYSAFTPSYYFMTLAQMIEITTDANYDAMRIWYRGPQEGNANISVYDMRGSLLFKKTVSYVDGDNNYEINISSLLPGIYVTEIESAGEIFREKLLIAR